MSAHYSAHRGIQRLRKLFGLENSECARCNGERSSRRARVPSSPVNQPTLSAGAVQLQPGTVLDIEDSLTKTIDGWTAYKTHQGSSLPMRRGTNREFFSYSTFHGLSNSQLMGRPMDLVTETFNAYCSEHGVQCTVTADPKDWRQLLHFTNVGDRLVRITHKGESRFLEPGESVTLGAKDWYSLAQDGLPKIEAINGGLVECAGNGDTD